METILLKSITFNSFEEKVKLIGEVHKDKLSYWTTFFIDVLDLNKILNLLQRKNQEIDINNLIQTSDFFDFTEYEINFEEIIDSQIQKSELDFFSKIQFKRQIRA